MKNKFLILAIGLFLFSSMAFAQSSPTNAKVHPAKKVVKTPSNSSQNTKKSEKK